MSAITNLQLVTDSGSNGDKITNDYRVSVNGTEGATNYLYRVQNLTTGNTFVTASGSAKNGWMSYNDYKAYMASANPSSQYKVQAALNSDIGSDGNVNNSKVGTLTFNFDKMALAPTVVLTQDTGASKSDGITSNGGLSVSGTETGASIQYSIDGGTTWTSSFAAKEGSNTVQVRQTDVAGNVSPAATLNFTLDTKALAPTLALTEDTGSSSSDGITSNGGLSVSGTETGATVQYSTDGGTTWSSSFAAKEGSNTVQARQTDVAGNVSPAATLNFTLDTKALAPTLALTEDTGSSSSDRITSNGGLTVSGTETGATVQYSTDGGTTWISSFAAIEGSNTVQVRQTDVAGNVSPAASLSFTLDTAAPSAPTVALAEDTGSLSTDLITSNGGLSVTDTEKDATVQYSTDGGTTWSSSFAAKEGSNTVQVRQTDLAGNVSPAASLSFTLDTQALAPTVALAEDTGSLSSDGITSKGGLTVSGTETGATVQYSIDNGTTWTSSFAAIEGSNTVQVRQTDVAGNVSPAASLSFTLDTAAPSAPTVALAEDTGSLSSDLITSNGGLSVTDTEKDATVQYSTDGGTTWSSSFAAKEGSNTVQVRQTDVAGNVSPAASLSFTLDTQALAPTVALAEDTGSSSSDGITSKGGLTVGGTETGATVQYSIDGGTTWTSSFAAIEGSNTVQVRQTDVAGNVSPAASLSFTLDSLAPAALGVVLTNDTGASATDLISSKGGLTVTGTEKDATVEYSIDGGTTWSSSFAAKEGSNDVQVRQTDLAGNVSPAASLSFTLDTQALAPTVALAEDTGSSSSDGITSKGGLIVGGTETGATVQYSIDNGTTWTSSFAAIEGSNTVQVRQTDVAGNVSPAASLSFTLDSLAPAALGVILTNDTGSSAIDLITSKGDLTVSGTETGATVQYSIDNGTTWTSSFAAIEGGNTVQVRQTDVAGNASPATSLSFTLDTQALAPTVVLTNDTGASATDFITSKGGLTVGGTETGATVQYSIDNGTTWTSSFAAIEGSNTVQVRQTDLAGNVSPAASLSFKLDTVTNVNIASITSGSQPTLSGTAEAGDTLNITLDGGTSVIGTVTVGSNGAWSWAYPNTLTSGNHSFTALATDLAGNTASSIKTVNVGPTFSFNNGNFQSGHYLINNFKSADTLAPVNAQIIYDSFVQQDVTITTASNGKTTISNTPDGTMDTIVHYHDNNGPLDVVLVGFSGFTSSNLFH